MSSYGKISYTDFINQVRANGWTIETQTPDSTVITKKRGAPGMVVIPLALIPVLGMIIGLAWIAIRGTATVTVERKLTQARVLTPTNEFDINNRDDMEFFFNDYAFRGSVSYYPVAITGGIVLIVGIVLLQLLGAPA